jgi:ATP-dependent Clp protease ATP-binding subunit ClpB
VDDTAFDLLIDVGFDPIYKERFKHILNKWKIVCSQNFIWWFQIGDNILIKGKIHLVFDMKLS